MATLYVNAATGDNARSYATAQNSATPWLTIARAAWGDGYGGSTWASPNTADTAQAGDTVSIAAGTYTENGAGASGGRFDVALNPANNGTVGNPITFRGVGTVNIRMTSGHTGPTIGAENRDYIIWDNIQIDDAFCGSVSDTGPVTFHLQDGGQLLNSTIVGTFRSWFDNYNGIRTESTNNVLIKNVTISNLSGNGGGNVTGIMMYDSADMVMEHLNISDVPVGIYIKGDSAGNPIVQSNTIVRFSRIHDIGRGIQVSAAYQAKIYQNIIKSSSAYGIRQDNFISPQAEQVTIQNNVIVAHSNGTSIGYSADGGTSNIVNLRVFNNIFTGSFYEAVNFGLRAIPDSTFEHNVYNGYTTWGSYDGAQRSFATWTGTGKDSASPASVTSDPLFVNTTDYKLTGSSPAKNLGVDILDLDGDLSTSDNVDAGAYITGNETIGVESDSVSSVVMFI